MTHLIHCDGRAYLMRYPASVLESYVGTVCWEQPLYVFAYRQERFMSYTVSDMDWASWCGIGQKIEVLYDKGRGGRPKMPSGYVLPDDWSYKCEGYVDPINIRVGMGWSPCGVSTKHVTKISGV